MLLLRLTLVLALACSLGCTVTRDLEASGEEGAAQALEVPGRSLGTIKVWSGGITSDVTGAEPTRVRLYVRVDNHDAEGLTLTDLALVVYTHAGERLRREPTPDTAGERSVRPGRTLRTGLRFELPGEVAIRDVERIDLEWTIHSPAGRVIRSTRFEVVGSRLEQRS
ncbi:MAG TPA: hypothetical protein DEA08_38470 [Planctomycetes bacterium]|nr:hypothetical protein [Planctomycetota bacterium]|tara:strand:+ start:565 stop:1065 length:501 start_codon:yes stop_codon:yes gene_type:complete